MVYLFDDSKKNVSFFFVFHCNKDMLPFFYEICDYYCFYKTTKPLRFNASVFTPGNIVLVENPLKHLTNTVFNRLSKLRLQK